MKKLVGTFGVALSLVVACKPLIELGQGPDSDTDATDDTPTAGSSGRAPTATGGSAGDSSGGDGGTTSTPIGGSSESSAGDSNAGSAGDASEGGASAGGAHHGSGGDSGGSFGGDPGTGGSVAGGPTAGAGTGGSRQEPTASLCEPSTDVIAFGCVLASDGEYATTDFEGDVLVTSVREATSELCRSHDNDPWFRAPMAHPATEVTVRTSDAREWRVIFGLTGMPATHVQSGDELNFSLDSYEGRPLFTPILNQTFVLAREERMVLFVTSQVLYSLLPNFDRYGIRFEPGPLGCERELAGGTCQFSAIGYGSTRAYVGSAEDVVRRGESKRIGDLVLTVEEHSKYDSRCDAFGTFLMGGFIASP